MKLAGILFEYNSKHILLNYFNKRSVNKDVNN